MGRGKESLESLRKAEEIQHKLLAADPSWSAVAGDLAATSNNLGLALRGAGEIQAAQAMFGAAIELQENLIAESPESEAVLHGLAASYNNLGSLDENSAGNGAAKFYEKAIAIQRRLVESDPINRIYQGDLARTYNNLGYVLANRSDWKHAELCYGDAIALQEHLVKASPLAASYRRDLAISYNNLGMAQSRGGEPVKAEDSFRQAVRLQQLLLDAEPDDAKTLSNQGGVFNNLGMLLEGQRRYGDAEDAYRQAIRLQRQCVRRRARPDDDSRLAQQSLSQLRKLPAEAGQERSGGADLPGARKSRRAYDQFDTLELKPAMFELLKQIWLTGTHRRSRGRTRGAGRGLPVAWNNWNLAPCFRRRLARVMPVPSR